MKKFYVGTHFNGTKTVYAYTVAEAAYKVKATLPKNDSITYVEVFESLYGKHQYVRYLPEEHFEEMTDDEYEMYLYT